MSLTTVTPKCPQCGIPFANGGPSKKLNGCPIFVFCNVLSNVLFSRQYCNTCCSSAGKSARVSVFVYAITTYSVFILKKGAMRPSHRRSAVASYLIIIIVCFFIVINFTLYFFKMQVLYLSFLCVAFLFFDIYNSQAFYKKI